MKKRFFEIEIGSPPDYEELVAYIYHNDESMRELLYGDKEIEGDYYVNGNEVAIITKEEGPEKVKIKFSEYATQNDLNVDELLKAIKEAKEELLK